MTSISNVHIAYYGPGVTGGNFIHVISFFFFFSLFLTLFPTPHSCKVNINPIRQMQKLKAEKFTHSN